MLFASVFSKYSKNIHDSLSRLQVYCSPRREKMTNAKRVQLLAYSSRLAWAFKAGISLLLSAVLALIVWDEKAFSIFFFLFTIVGIITDIVLYRRRDHIFSFSVQNEDVPEKYGLTAEELIVYAKNISKVRLCRLPTSLLIFPLALLSIPDSLLIVFLVSTLMGYYPAALADAFWAKKFGIKLPSSFKLIFEFGPTTHAVSSLSTTSFRETEKNNYVFSQTSTWGYQHSILNPLNNIPTPITPPSIPSCLSNNY